MLKKELLLKLNRVEMIASVSKLRRMLIHPIKYIDAILFREIIYKKSKKGREITCKTFFQNEMHILLPASTDIYLTGGKSHDSEVRLAKYLILNLHEMDTFMDIGAHYGYFSLLASRIVGEKGHVVSFEASPTTFRILEKNSTKDRMLKVYNYAISNTNNDLIFYEFPNLYSEYNTLEVEQFSEEEWFKLASPKKVKVSAIILDDFFSKENYRPHIIKIDVEGAEYKVLSGANDYLNNNSPSIVMEYLSAQRGNEAHLQAENLLKSKGYLPYLIDSKGQLNVVANINLYLDENELESDNIVFIKKNDIGSNNI